MKILFKEKEIFKKNVSINGWKFQQPEYYTVYGDCLYPYEIILDKEHFVNLIEVCYNDFTSELREDDAKCNDFDPPYEGALDYPTLRDFVKIDGKALAKFISGIQDIINALFWHGLKLEAEDKDNLCTISTLDDVIEQDETIILKGLALDMVIWNEIVSELRANDE